MEEKINMSRSPDQLAREVLHPRHDAVMLVRTRMPDGSVSVTWHCGRCDAGGRVPRALAELLAIAEAGQRTIEAIGRECERASDVRANRTGIIGNVHLLVQQFAAAAPPPADQRAAICPECGSGLLDGEHIADYLCSLRVPTLSPADHPIGRVEGDTLHWEDADGVKHSGPFVAPSPADQKARSYRSPYCDEATDSGHSSSSGLGAA